jgi:hypothetical protein
LDGPRRKTTATGDFRAKIIEMRAATGPCAPFGVTLTFCMIPFQHIYT